MEHQTKQEEDDWEGYVRIMYHCDWIGKRGIPCTEHIWVNAQTADRLYDNSAERIQGTLMFCSTHGDKWNKKQLHEKNRTADIILNKKQ